MTHDSDDLEFLDALEETHALGELLSDTSSKPAHKPERCDVPVETAESWRLYTLPLGSVIRAMPWTGESGDRAAPTVAEAVDAPRQSDSRGDSDNYLQSISW